MSGRGVFDRSTWLAALGHFGETRCALRSKGRRVDYAELAAAAREAGARLEASGVEPGDLVAILAPPSLAGVATLHALLGRGVVMLPLNLRSTAVELRATLEASAARFLLYAGDAPGGPPVEAFVAGLDCGLLSMTPDEDGLTPRFERQRAPGSRARFAGTGTDEDKDKGKDKDKVEGEAAMRRAARLGEGAALVLETSGTSGRQKRAVLGFEQLIASARAAAELLGSRGSDRWLLCMPLFHIGGLSILIRAALVGAEVVLQERFDEAEVVSALENEGVTRVSFVAAMLDRVLAARGDQRAPDSLELVLLGGGPASDGLLSRAAALGYPIAPTYGLTEAASQVATRPPGATSGDPEDLAGGLRALPGVDLRLVDEAGRALARAGEPGEIEVRGPVVMLGYLEDPEATAQAFHDGWLRTGDFGVLDASGGLRVLDRRADLILSGGENVYPAEIESRLEEAPGVREVGVFGVPDARFGARPVAAVVMREGAVFDAGALADFCRNRLAGHKRPVAFVAVEALPRTATGKLLRRVLRAQYSPKAGSGGDSV